jgi:hypothetical protein
MPRQLAHVRATIPATVPAYPIARLSAPVKTGSNAAPSTHAARAKSLERNHHVQPSPRLRRAVAAVLLTAALPALSGCAAGFDSPVLRDYNPAVGVNVRTSGVWAMNMLVVMPESGRGTLVGALLNKTQTTDRLVGATVAAAPEKPPLQSTMQRSSVALAPDRLVELSDPTTVQVQGEAEPGEFLSLTLQFQRTKAIQVDVPVVDAAGPYADVPLP